MSFARYLLFAVLLLSGCKVELYSALPEEDANQMLAILMLHHIEADKQVLDGSVTLRVEQSQFISAVDLLRLNGYPRRHYTSVESMFPANQLVVSPIEEQQKIMYLKEQRIEGMLSQMEGVVRASVTIAARAAANNDGDALPASVAVFIKYAPQVNLESFRVQIRNLIQKSVPGLQPEQISILMQPAEFRMLAIAPPSVAPAWQAPLIRWISHYRMLLMMAIALLLLGLSSLLIVFRLNRRK